MAETDPKSRIITDGQQIAHPLQLINKEIKLLTPQQVKKFNQIAEQLQDTMQSPNITLGVETFNEYTEMLTKIGRLTKPIKPVNGALSSFLD